ncbi:MAG: hypothetical protein R3D34_04780 [Nitratireductor sp.]
MLVPTVTRSRIDQGLISSQAGENLKLIANFGNGVDNIDVAAAAARGLPSPTRPTYSRKTRRT